MLAPRHQASPSATAAEGVTHIVGGGLAGLSAAVHLTKAGHRVAVYERSTQTGGRCRSYHDQALDCLIDNGNHLMMTGNRDVRFLVDLVGAQDRFIIGAQADYPFIDCATGQRWTIAINDGNWPGWLFDQTRRVPGTSLWDYRGLIGILMGDKRKPLLAHLDASAPLYHKFWEPLILAVMNIEAGRADTGLMRQVMHETVLKGGEYSRPMIAREGLGPDLVQPLVDWLEGHGVCVQYRQNIKRLAISHGRVMAIELGGDEGIALGDQDHIILATPPTMAAKLLPSVTTPEEGEPILNLHFKVAGLTVPDDWPVPMLGLVNSLAQWVFVRDGLASVTVSAARDLPSQNHDDLATGIWSEIRQPLGCASMPMPEYRLIQERRATFTQTPDNVIKRPASDIGLDNLRLAGDWTDTGLPATIEGAVRSGRLAAHSLMSAMV
ncbi:MAG: hydroxysqualene dehydroxylase HpnE [Pseudomonadota bacterium]